MIMLKIKIDTKFEQKIVNMKTVSDKEKALMILHSKGYSYHRCGDYLNMNFRQVRYMFQKLKDNKEVYDLLY